MYQTHQAVQQDGAGGVEGEVAGVVDVEDGVQQEHGSQEHHHLLHRASEQTDIHVPVVENI
jgi:hypothetical protein